MSNIIHRQVKIRVKEIDKQAWCVLADVAKAEHLTHPAELRKKIPEECTTLSEVRDKKGRLQEMRLINLDGLALLLGKSLIEKIAEMQKFHEQISQKNLLQQKQIKSALKGLLEIWG